MSAERHATQPLEAGDPARLLNREFSWLDFNSRVLALAEDPELPPLERAKFVAIFSQNLDQFFQIRVAGLHAQIDAGVKSPSPDGRTPAEQLQGIRARTVSLARRAGELFSKELLPTLADAGISICDWGALDASARRHLGKVFEERIFPVLTPLSVDPAHPFPHVSDLSLNLAIVVRDPATAETRFARLKVPSNLPRFLALPDGERWIPAEAVIAAHLEPLFPGMEIVSNDAFRLTRDADLVFEEDDAEDLLLAIETGLKSRRRMHDAVRLEVAESMSDHARDLLLEELELDPEDVYGTDTLLGLDCLWEIHALERPELKGEPWKPCTPPRLRTVEGEPDFFEVLKHGDLLVHHPYDSFDATVGRFLFQAATDPDVLAIKHTLYRTSGPGNPIVRNLIQAAQSGKQAVALVELKARFDEAANIEWARTLEQAGVHVVYGLVGLKTHAKIALVVRQESGGIRRYCHIATGNYNPTTARLYEDIGLFSADPELCTDLTRLFNQITGASRPMRYRKLLVAPSGLRTALLELIEGEMEAPDGRIVIKVNSLSDPEIIDALYAASGAGVEIDLVVRGICCLRPGVPGLSEHIRVRSILGSFLEHSRIFRFGSEARGRRYYIGSADVMPRNLDRRMEVVVPVEDPALQARVETILAVNLADEGQAWSLGPDGTWERVENREGVCTHATLQKLTLEASTSDGVSTPY